MAEEFSAGSISVELKAQFENLSTGLLQAQQQLKQFSDGMQQTANQVGTSSSSVGKSFDDIGKKTETMNTSFLRATTRLLGIQIALQTLITGQGNVGALKEGLQALSNGFSTAAAAMHVFQGNISLLGAGILGAGVAAISYLTRSIEESIKATDALTAEEIKSLNIINAYGNAIQDAQVKATIFGSTLSERMGGALRITESAFSSNQKRLREFSDEISAIQQKLSAEQGRSVAGSNWLAGVLPSFLGGTNTDQIGRLNNQIDVLKNQQSRLQLQQQDITAAAPMEKANAEIAKLTDNLKKARDAFADIQDEGKRALDLGVITPAEEAARNLSAAKKVLDDLLAKDEDVIRQAGKFSPGSAENKSLLAQLASSTDIGQAQGQFLDAQRRKEAVQNAGNLAAGLSRSIGDGISQGILNGQSAMQTLANVGQNLFSNMLTKSVDTFEKGMVKAFESISGIGGEALGAALTGVLGVLGGIFSRRRSGSTSYNAVQSQIQSTQAVRGIVAGPTSVSIEAVGQDLTRANKPVVDKLEEIRVALINLRLSGGGAGGFQFAGSVSTP